MSNIAPSLEAIRPGAFEAHATIAAGDDDRIPRLFLAMVDVAVMGLAFLAAQAFAPDIQRSLLPGGAFSSVLPSMFPVPTGPTAVFPPISEGVWLLLATVPVSLVVLELIGGYGRVLGHSFLRLVLNPAFSQVVAISFGSLIVVALKLSTSSRVVIFTYGLLSTVGLVAYRGAIWGYQQRRLKRGVYAKNILVVGHPRSVEWIVRHFARHVQETEFRLTGWLGVRAAPTRHPDRRRSDAAREIPLTRLGGVDDLGALLVNHPVHEVIAIQATVERDWLRDVIDH